jgi:hypothetical protein
MSYIDL